MSPEATLILLGIVGLICTLLGAMWYLASLIGDVKTTIQVNAAKHEGEITQLRADVNRHDHTLKEHDEAINTMKFGGALQEIAKAAKHVAGQ